MAAHKKRAPLNAITYIYSTAEEKVRFATRAKQEGFVSVSEMGRLLMLERLEDGRKPRGMTATEVLNAERFKLLY